MGTAYHNLNLSIAFSYQEYIEDYSTDLLRRPKEIIEKVKYKYHLKRIANEIEKNTIPLLNILTQLNPLNTDHIILIENIIQQEPELITIILKDLDFTNPEHKKILTLSNNYLKQNILDLVFNQLNLQENVQHQDFLLQHFPYSNIDPEEVIDKLDLRRNESKEFLEIFKHASLLQYEQKSILETTYPLFNELAREKINEYLAR